jgi:RHS repeat-associated protein
MNKVFFFITFSMSLLYGAAKGQNPYQSIGKPIPKGKMLTLSDGKFQEFFPNDTLVPIGSVMYNTVTGQVVAFLTRDTMYAEYNLEPEVVSRWLSVDPLAQKFTRWSPYNYVKNNPILLIDPDGMAADTVRPATGQSAQFVAEFNQVVDKLKEIGESQGYDQMNNSTTVYEVKETDGMSGDAGSRFDPATKTIHWNTRMGLLNGETLVTMSPASVLAHELDHGGRWDNDKAGIRADQKIFDPDFGNKEEKRVIEGSEQRVALKLNEIKAGEVTRRNHGESPMTTSGPFSTQPPSSNSKTERGTPSKTYFFNYYIPTHQ